MESFGRCSYAPKLQQARHCPKSKSKAYVPGKVSRTYRVPEFVQNLEEALLVCLNRSVPAPPGRESSLDFQQKLLPGTRRPTHQNRMTNHILIFFVTVCWSWGNGKRTKGCHFLFIAGTNPAAVSNTTKQTSHNGCHQQTNKDSQRCYGSSASL